MDSSVYTRPNKPKKIAVKKRDRDFTVSPVEVPELLSVDKDTECHVTPASEARRMAMYLDPREGMSVIEPECGTGSLLGALLDLPVSLDITAVERHYSLISSAKARFPGRRVDFKHECFLDYAAQTEQKFDRVLMNPPFRKTKAHVNAALGLLKDGGRVIALVPSTFEHPEAEDLERLGNHTFPNARVYTKIIEIEK